jgi:sulfur carrier protein ThiS
MRIYLGGHLNFYHPQKANWLTVALDFPAPLVEILERTGVPLGEVHLVVINGEQVDLEAAVVSADDEVKLFSAVGGG